MCSRSIASVFLGSLWGGRTKKGTVGLRRSPQKHPCQELLFSRGGWIASGDPLFDPLADFLVAPGDPALSELYPLGELARLFESRDVLETVWNSERLELLFETSSLSSCIVILPCQGASRCSPGTAGGRPSIAFRLCRRERDMAAHGRTWRHTAKGAQNLPGSGPRIKEHRHFRRSPCGRAL